MYLEDEVIKKNNAENQPATVLSTPGNTTTFVPIIDSPTPSPTLSPFHTPEHTPHSSPKPTRPPPAIPTQKKENDIRDFRKDSQDILIPRVTVDPPSTHTIYAHVDPTLSSPVHAPPRPARSATNSPALAYITTIYFTVLFFSILFAFLFSVLFTIFLNVGIGHQM